MPDNADYAGARRSILRRIMGTPTAAELDAVAEQKRAEDEGREITWCDCLDRGLPCMKIKGHNGPHYFRWPGP